MMEPASLQSPAAGDGLMLFALDTSRDFGREVSRHLGIELAPYEERQFEDGEHKTRPMAGVRGQDVYVLYSLYGDQEQSTSDKLCRLWFFIATLKDAGAARVTAVVPYLAYARKDRRTKARDPVTTRYIASLFEAVGTDAVMTMDVHNLAAYQNAFRCRSEHLEALPLFVRHFQPLIQEHDVVVVAPDAGSIKRAEQFRQRLMAALGKPIAMAFAEKHRSEGKISGDLLVGEVDGRHAIILDDLVSTGSTLMRTARACRERGAACVMAAATHGLFAGEAASILADPALERIVVTDTVPPLRLPDGPVKAKLTVLDSTAWFAEAIRRLHSGGSLTELMAS